jgi:MFS family permease
MRNTKMFLKIASKASKPFPSIPPSIWVLGSVSFLMKISSVIVYSLTPLFVTQVLGASTLTIGFLEGFVEAIALSSKIFSGILSDWIHKRKSIIAFGYVLAFLSRPLLAIATSMGGVFLGKAFDRVGNGLDATPRDALVGDLAPPEIKGACYGLRESLSRAGAFVGSLVAVGLLWITQNNYPLVFWIASIPTALALFLLMAFVKDPLSEKFQKKKIKKHLELKDILALPLRFWLTICLSGLFMLSNFSGAFLILKAESTGLDIYLVPLVMVIQNIATASTAYPVGYLSDKVGRRSMMALGISLVVISDLCLGSGQSIYFVLFGVFIWGAQMGITQSLLAIFLADACPQDLRGTGFGLFHLINGLCLIVANIISGWIWSEAGPSPMFYFSAVVAVASSFILPFIHKPLK